MKIRFYNAKILSMEPDRDPSKTDHKPVLYDGEIRVDGTKISYAGPEKEPAGTGEAFDQEIDCGGNVLMPGFKDAHTHSGMTFLRSSADDMPLQSWLNEQVFPFEAKLTPEDIAVFSKVAILEYLTGGITSCMEMYLTPESIAKAFQDMGFRLVQVGSVNSFSQSTELVDQWYSKLNGVSDLTSFQLGFHAEYTSSRELVGRIAALADKYKAPVFVHVSETAAEVQGCIDRYGKTPVAFLAGEGVFDYGGAGYHLVHTTEDDWRIMKQKHIDVVSNPGSNTKLASGIAPVGDYLRLGIPVALGTDGPASNNCLDMFREMFLVTGLGKLREKDASAVPAYEVLKMATYNGAHVMRQPETDSLAKGKTADLILLDLNQPNMQPVNNIADNIVYSGSKLNVLLTMVNGKILYDRLKGPMRFHVGEDVSDIYREANARKKAILGR